VSCGRGEKMPISLDKVHISEIQSLSRKKNQEAISRILKQDPFAAYSIKELQESAGVKYPAATLIAVNALVRKGLVEKFVNESDNLTYVHWIGDEETRVLVTKSKKFIEEEEENEILDKD
jgi:DNA-binding MarR family transcriptional regulator